MYKIQNLLYSAGGKKKVQSVCKTYHWRRERLPTPVFLPGEFHRQRSLVATAHWGHKELDMFVGHIVSEP